MTFVSFLADHAWNIIAMGGLLIASAFFSGTETALFSLSPAQVDAARRRPGGKTVTSLLARTDHTLNLLLLGNMIVNVAFAAIAAVMSLNLQQAGGQPWQVVATSVGALLALILFGEVAPKMAAAVIATRWSLLGGRLVVAIGTVLNPVLWVLATLVIRPISTIITPRASEVAAISADELGALLDLSAKRGLLDDDAHALLREIVQLSQLRVGDVMVPRVDMIAWDINQPRQTLVDLIREKRLRRIAVHEGDVDRMLGIITAKHCLAWPDRPLRDLVQPAFYVPVTASIERVLLQFRKAGQRVGIAVDEYGGTAGLIGVEDILEEIVGDLPRPDGEPPQPAVTALGGGAYRVDGDLAIHEWAEVFNIDLRGGRISTIGGFVTSLLGRIPSAGQTVTYRNIRFTVMSLRGRRIGQLRIELSEVAHDA